MNCVTTFNAYYRRDPVGVSFCPYRICPLGAHIDHQNGKVTGFAIDQGIHIAFGPKQNGVVEMQSMQFPKRAQWHVRSTPEVKQGDWADYLRGATIMLLERYPLRIGLCGIVEGSIPIGGLSSSAAVTIAFLSALCQVNGLKPDKAELLEMALRAEREYVGVSVGKLDQSCEIYCRKDHLLYLDLKDGSSELIAQNPRMKPYEIMIFFSGLERNLQSSKYNLRVDEVKSASYALKAFAGLEYGKYADTRLRDVPRDVFEAYASRLPEPWRKRATHYYTEFDRVEQGVEAWRRGDLAEFGRLCFESGASSIENYEAGCDEMIALYNIMRRTDGIYGGRFSGAGFRGCCMALVDPSFTEQIRQSVTQAYTREFPDLACKFGIYICHSEDGVRL